MASVGAPRVHNLGPAPRVGVASGSLDAVPRNCCTTPCTGALWAAAGLAGPGSLRWRNPSGFARVVILLVFPHRQRGCGDATGQGQLGQVGLDARIGHSLEPSHATFSLTRSMDARTGSRPCRYADDGLVHCRTEQRAKAILAALAARFSECGWLEYYGRYRPSAMYSVLRHFNKTMVAWAKRKYLRLKRHTKWAVRFLIKISRKQPSLFVHWQRGMVGVFS
jgi:hypothetical protein